MPPDISTQQGAQEFAHKALEMFRAAFTKDGCLAPVAFLWLTKSPETGQPFSPPQMAIVALDLSDKDTTFANLKRLAILGMAQLCVFATETWKVTSPEPNADEEVRRYLREKKTLAEHPLRKEMIFVTFEHSPSNVLQYWEAEIVRSGETVLLGDFTTTGAQVLGLADGRASNILPPDPINVS